MLGVELIDGEYDLESWLSLTYGLENEPEKGLRCSVCFEGRFEATAKLAQKLNIKEYTSTLLTSPKKSLEQLSTIGDKIASRYECEFVSVDYRKNGGTQKQFALAKEDKLYHQNFCGCIYALSKQRDAQKKIADELFSPINRQILPDSIEEKIELYKQRVEYERNSQEYKIVREDFLNYRLLRGYIKSKKETIKSYILSYSTLKRKKSTAKVEYEYNGIYNLNRDNIKIITVDKVNSLIDKNYNNIKEMNSNPLSIKEELQLREKINVSFFSLSPIIIVDDISYEKYEIFVDSVIYQDVKEVLLKI
jgi:predicted adenine nucleotide alpha hydrolase (AANH) superfamily ATPase